MSDDSGRLHLVGFSDIKRTELEQLSTKKEPFKLANHVVKKNIVEMIALNLLFNTALRSVGLKTF